MSEAATSTWSFGGPLADAPVETAWTILAIAAAFCAVFAWVSYRNSVARLGVAASALLMLLRTALLVILLFCLANPTRLERRTAKAPEPPTPASPPRLAVVVDRSDSMTLPDNRGRSRLDDALVNWRRLEKTAQTFFGPVNFYSFAEDLKPAATLDEALKRTGGTGETRLYQSISTLLKTPKRSERPDAVVVLTDGVDTSNESESLLRESAMAAGVPVYFVPGNNRSARPDPFLRVREWRVPQTALRQSEFTLEVAFEAFSRADRIVPFSLWQAGRRVTGGDLALTTGSNLVARSFPVAVGEPGVEEFALRIGAGDEAPVAARAVTRVLAPQGQKVRVLIQQGAVDWGYRHLTEALRTDPSFEFLTLFTVDAGVAFVRGGPPGSPVLGRLPESAAPLAAFNCVILARPDPRRFTALQQQALTEFVRGGGAVLFVSPDPGALPYFATSALKEILPVFIDANPTPAALPSAENKLARFALTEAGRAGPIFASAKERGGFLLPRFREYAAVSRAKPGADVLAVHPTAVDAATVRPHILLATQTFGRGRTALLTTDTLWRWKLDEPSDSRAVETFWQQLVLAIARPPEPGNLRFVGVPAQVRIGQTVKLGIGGVASEVFPTVVTRAPDGRTGRLAVALTMDPEAPWSVDWTPDQAGSWELAAGLEQVRPANVFPLVVAEVGGELARSAPALETMRALAGETGGALLTQEPPAEWRREEKTEKKSEEVVMSESRDPRWNNWAILGVALGIYAVELLLRRGWKLL